MAYPNLPDISDLSDYRPKLPLRVYSADGVLIGEFGEERRNLTPIADIPKVMKDAVLAIEDSRFYSHGGVDYRGLMRAALANLGRVKSQGASTITMQVARNVYLSSEKTFTRKLYEVLLTFKLEHLLSKDQILEIYMNQIFLGNRAYGFAAAADTYFGKPMKDLTIAEAAMLAGPAEVALGQQPHQQPDAGPRRASSTSSTGCRKTASSRPRKPEAAKKQELKIRTGTDNATRPCGIRRRNRAPAGLCPVRRRGLYPRPERLHHHQCRPSRTPPTRRCARASWITSAARSTAARRNSSTCRPSDKDAEDAIDDALADHPDNGDVMSAVVLEANPKKILAVRQNGERLEITGEGLRPAQSGLSDKAPPKIKIRRGAVIRVARTPKNTWEITQLPEVEGAFVALDPRDGAIHALVGGFDFNKNKFNHVTQAWRQPGSASSPSSIRRRWKRASRRPPSSTTRRCSSTPASPAASPGSRRTTTASSKARCRCTRRWPSPRTWSRSASCRRWARRTRRTGSPASASMPKSTRPT